MKYVMKGGNMYYLSGSESPEPVACLRGELIGPEKRILSPDKKLLLRTDIRNLDASSERMSDVRFREYIAQDLEGNICALAKPDYAAGDDPVEVGWPICRAPKVDNAQLTIGEREYCLVMQNSQNYILRDSAEKAVAQILHRGLMGGWEIEADDDFAPELICGVFAFCRYIEQENELWIV